MSITTSLPNENATKHAVTAHEHTSATLGTPLRLETFARGAGSHPSRAIANGSRDTYSNWLLKSAQPPTRAASATKIPSQRPPIIPAMTGHPADSLQTDG